MAASKEHKAKVMAAHPNAVAAARSGGGWRILAASGSVQILGEAGSPLGAWMVAAKKLP